MAILGLGCELFCQIGQGINLKPGFYDELIVNAAKELFQKTTVN